MPFSISVKPPRLLLIEDNDGLAEATQEFLQREGFDVRLASSGREALGAAVAFQPDIVLCDLHLPDMAGVDVLSELRKTRPSGTPCWSFTPRHGWLRDMVSMRLKAICFCQNP